jgi:hypothetical protein
VRACVCACVCKEGESEDVERLCWIAMSFYTKSSNTIDARTHTHTHTFYGFLNLSVQGRVLMFEHAAEY